MLNTSGCCSCPARDSCTETPCRCRRPSTKTLYSDNTPHQLYFLCTDSTFHVALKLTSMSVIYGKEKVKVTDANRKEMKINRAVRGRPPQCPRPGLQVVTQYTSYTHMDRSLTRCPCWPASTANQSGLVTDFDLLTLKVVSESHVTWAISVPILVFLGLSVLDLGPMYATDISC